MGKNEAMIKKKAPEKYSPSEIELKWQRVWEEEGVYQPDMASAKRPFYNLMMFPYPSAEGLHVGSVFAFSGVDIYGRFKRMQGNDVFEPIGLDGFGIHSENHAIKTGTHPMEHAKRTEENFYRQLHSIGNGFDWRVKVETYDPDYYKWTQWLFTELFKAGLAYRKKSPVNFCPSCKTVLADEQVIEKSKIKDQKSKIEEKVKVCERCDTEIEKRNLEQWFFRITKYADRLVENIEKLDWTEKVKIAQRNWIGRSEGARIEFKVQNSKFKVEVFTTRPDTLYGATFLVLSPEHELIAKLLNGEVSTKNKEQIRKYIDQARQKSEQERMTEGKEKTGVFSGVYAINPTSNEEIQIWIADYILMGYGTGAIMAVPAHDGRDFDFAEKFGLEVKRVVIGKDGDTSPITRVEQVQEEEGKMVNSGFLDGMDIHEATEKIMDHMEEKGWGKRETAFHLRDWLISRQRYWGPPIPMIYCESCASSGDSWFTISEAKEQQRSKIKDSSFAKATADKQKSKMIGDYAYEMRGWYPVDEKDLPVELPYVEDYKPAGTGKAPLANYPDFYETKCPVYGHSAKRETDVSDTFLDSAWYFFRYTSTEFDDRPFDKLRVEKWLPVNSYIGGAEHSVLHLLYARFITMVLHDLGHITFEEPFAKFYAHGLIIKDGAKMSKSRGNVINPDEYIRKFGADTLRMYLHFLGPFDAGGDFRDTGIEGMHRFLKRVYTLFRKSQKSHQFGGQAKVKSQKLNEEALRMMHGTIAGVTEDMEHLRYNTAIAKLMSYYNFLVKQEVVSLEEENVYLRLLAPFAPHITEELYQQTSKGRPQGIAPTNLKSENLKINSIHKQPWPQSNSKYTQEDTVMIPVQVNGKLRDMLKDQRSKIKDQKYVEKMAKESEKVRRYLEGKKILKVIYVQGKVINFVVRE